MSFVWEMNRQERALDLNATIDKWLNDKLIDRDVKGDNN